MAIATPIKTYKYAESVRAAAKERLDELKTDIKDRMNRNEAIDKEMYNLYEVLAETINTLSDEKVEEPIEDYNNDVLYG